MGVVTSRYAYLELFNIRFLVRSFNDEEETCRVDPTEQTRSNLKMLKIPREEPLEIPSRGWDDTIIITDKGVGVDVQVSCGSVH